MTSLSKQYGDWFVTDGVTVGPGSDGVAYNWSYEPPPVPSPASGPSPAGAYFAQGSDSAPETQTDVVPASAPLSSATAVGAVAGTPHADVFPLDIATVNAAVAPVPQPAQITGYSALQGDVIDFSAILHGSYAPLTPDTAQLHITASATSATLDFNVGTAEHPHWTALATLDGVHAGDTVNVALDATHTVHLQAAWLA